VSIVDFPYAVRSRCSTSYARATATAAAAPGAGFVMGEGWGENARQEKRQRFSTDEPAARRLADLENTLRLIGLDASEYVPLIAPLVDIPLPEERAAKLAAEELGRRQLAALTAWLLTGARSQPVVLAFEDLHWADPTSLDLMQALSERGRPAPCAIAIPKSDQDRHLMTVALHPISQSRSLSLPAARRTRTAMSSQALAEPLRASTRAQAAHRHDRNKLAIVLPIDAIFSPLQDRPRRSVRDPQIPIGRAL
jgi:hypothetical protein